jgi:hypothetical protein
MRFLRPALLLLALGLSACATPEGHLQVSDHVVRSEDYEEVHRRFDACGKIEAQAPQLDSIRVQTFLATQRQIFSRQIVDTTVATHYDLHPDSSSRLPRSVSIGAMVVGGVMLGIAGGLAASNPPHQYAPDSRGTAVNVLLTAGGLSFAGGSLGLVVPVIRDANAPTDRGLMKVHTQTVPASAPSDERVPAGHVGFRLSALPEATGTCLHVDMEGETEAQGSAVVAIPHGCFRWLQVKAIGEPEELKSALP